MSAQQLQFEAWYRVRWPSNAEAYLVKTSTGRYHSTTTRDLWHTWQAAQKQVKS